LLLLLLGKLLLLLLGDLLLLLLLDKLLLLLGHVMLLLLILWFPRVKMLLRCEWWRRWVFP